MPECASGRGYTHCQSAITQVAAIVSLPPCALFAPRSGHFSVCVSLYPSRHRRKGRRMNINRREIGNRIQTLRRDRNISQEQAAMDLHLSRSTISKIETDGRITSLETLVQLSDYYHVSTDYILKGISEKTGVAEELQAIIALLTSLAKRL